MSLRIYNTLSRAVEDFSPLIPGQVRMYVCGMTVYDLCHLGHARAMVAFDVVQRWLKTSGLNVIYVRNVTDIDDKIIKRALENGETIRALTDRMVEALHQDADALGIERPTHEPRATDYVPQMLSLIGRLEEKGLAYQAQSGSSQGDVNYAVRKFPGYGKLSGKSLDELRAGERVDVQDGKDDPLDFVLWKSAKPTEPADAKWDSAYGPGRPGWHIECSAMACELLGESFDIHGGGADLQFPHHENEIAQSEGATLDAATGHGQPLARFWMHNGFVRVDNEKMSKSLGNFFTIREVLGWVRDPEVIRYFILSSHYRGPINYAVESLDQADAGLERLYIALRGVELPASVARSAASDRFEAAMNDDFNTSLALSELQQLAREINVAKTAKDLRLASQLAGEMVELAKVIGVVQQVPDVFLRKAAPKRGPEAYSIKAARGAHSEGKVLSDGDIDQLIALRVAARKSKDWKESDRIRDELSAQGILLEDGPQGTTWRRR